MSKKVTKVDGSINGKNGLEYAVGVKSLGLLSTTIDKALMLKDEETQLKCSPEYAEGATIDLTLVQVAKKYDEKAISDKTATEKAESENVVVKTVSAQQVSTEKAVDEKAQEEKMTIAKSTVANVAAAESECRRQMSSYHIMASVLVRSRKFWNNSPERAHTNTATVQQDAPRDVGPSVIGSRAKVCKVLGWCQLASGLQMRTKTQVFRLLRTRSFSASHLRSNLSVKKARS